MSKGTKTEGILVCRVSDARQEQHGFSLEAQEETGREYACLHGIKLIQEPFVFQETASKRAQRKKFRRVLDFIDGYKGTGALAVLAARYSRLTRNSHDQAAIDELVDEGRISLHLFREARVIEKHSSPGDRLATDVDAAVAKHKARETGRAAKDGMDRKRRSGWFTHKAPPGYKNIEVDPIEAIEMGIDLGPSRRARERVIVPDERTAPMVARMFELRAEGHSLEAICDRLKAEGLAPPDKLHVLKKQRVHEILRKPFYGGRFQIDGEWYEGRHELIISAQLFERVQRTFEERPRQPLKRDRGGIFTGFIRCADPECGCLILWERKKNRYDYWRCSNGRRIHKRRKYVSQDKLFSQFEQALAALEITDKLAQAVANELRRSHARLVSERQRAADGFKAALRRLDVKRDRLVDLLMEERIDDATYQAKKEQLRIERERLTDKLTAAQNAMDGEYLDVAQATIELAKNLKSMWNASTPREKRDLLEKLVSNPVLEGETLRFEWKKPFRLLGEMAREEDWLGNQPSPRTACRRRDQAIFPHGHHENNGEFDQNPWEGRDGMGNCPDVDLRG